MEKETPRLRGHVGRGNPGRRLMTKRHPKTESLPLHAAGEGTIGSSNNPIGVQEEPRTDRIGISRHECGTAFKTGDGILFDRQWVKLGADSVRLCLPFLLGLEFPGELRFPERNMTDTSNAKNDGQLRALGTKLADLLLVGGKDLLRGEMALGLGDGQLTQGTVKRLLHGVLEGSRIAGFQGIAFGIAPFVHIESVTVVAGDPPFLEEKDRPAIHPHRPHRQNHGQTLAGFAGPANRHGDLVAHVCIEVRKCLAHDRAEVFMPPRLTISHGLRVVVDTGIDCRQIPPGGKKTFEQGALNC